MAFLADLCNWGMIIPLSPRTETNQSINPSINLSQASSRSERIRNSFTTLSDPEVLFQSSLRFLRFPFIASRKRPELHLASRIATSHPPARICSTPLAKLSYHVSTKPSIGIAFPCLHRPRALIHAGREGCGGVTPNRHTHRHTHKQPNAMRD
jgi:hypothetical protein